MGVGPERFRREIETAARLEHPHILPVFDSGEANGLLYYVMPFVEGESLRGRLRREQQFAIADAITVTCEVADALAYAHGMGQLARACRTKRGTSRRVLREHVLLHPSNILRERVTAFTR